jgi:hypothetical protein
MKRENFYILLDLAIDPPEDDQKIIELAIKKKQTEWSRFRNHPTKALLARQYIDMLPEIHRVMSNPELRKAEAANARQTIARESDEKFSVIDRHLAICMSKGFVTDEEIFNLAKRHSVKANDIKKRISQKESETHEKIDKQLKLRTAKGYITRDEIAELAKTHSVSEKEIRARITCPIKKTITETTKNAKPLEKAVAKIIERNLKITGKQSLYQFLDLPPNATLEALQKKATLKEQKLRKIGKKDALATAGIALAGHCLTIFKTPESRNAYDMANAGLLFKDLNSDIDVAGMDGKIRSEYYEALLNSAVKLGMEKNQARRYIQDYADRKNLKIENKTKKPAWILPAVIIAVALMLGAGYLYIKKENTLKQEYRQILTDMENAGDIQNKALLLNNYISSHKESGRTIDAAKRLKKLRLAIDEQQAKEFTAKAEKLLAENKHQKALIIYNDFLSRYPQSLYADKIRKKITKISAILDDMDFQALNILKGEPVIVRAGAYYAYLQKHPKGKNIESAKQILSKMRKEYHIALLKNIDECTKNETWEKGILLCDAFIKTYKGSKPASEIKEQQNILRTRLWEKETFERMMLEVKAGGDDYQAGKQILTDYLKAYPDSYINDKIKKELAGLEQKEKTAKIKTDKKYLTSLIKKAGRRFTVNGDDTVKDNKTGLTWCLIDSRLDTGDCLDYDSAIEYVNNLRTGGHKDWRLPTAGELAQLYKQKPFFPRDKAEWYWTSKSYTRYADGWSKAVETITSTNEETWGKEQRDSRDCGSVRAAR